jgi:hypothetical protein
MPDKPDEKALFADAMSDEMLNGPTRRKRSRVKVKKAIQPSKPDHQPRQPDHQPKK